MWRAEGIAGKYSINEKEEKERDKQHGRQAPVPQASVTRQGKSNRLDSGAGT